MTGAAWAKAYGDADFVLPAPVSKHCPAHNMQPSAAACASLPNRLLVQPGSRLTTHLAPSHLAPLCTSAVDPACQQRPRPCFGGQLRCRHCAYCAARTAAQRWTRAAAPAPASCRPSAPRPVAAQTPPQGPPPAPCPLPAVQWRLQGPCLVAIHRSSCRVVHLRSHEQEPWLDVQRPSWA